MARSRRWACLALAVVLVAPVSRTSAAPAPEGDLELGVFGCLLAATFPDPPEADEAITSPDLGGEVVNEPTGRSPITAVLSNSDPVGHNADGNVEAFYVRQIPNFLVPQQLQVFQATDTTGDNQVGRPAMSDRVNSHGLRIDTGKWNLPPDPDIAGNDDLNLEMFQFELNPNGSVGQFQLTDTTGPAAATATAISASGARILFASSQNFGSNPMARPQLFVFDNVPGGGVAQVTTNDGNFPITDISLNDAGTVATFLSSGNLTGDNLDHSVEFFSATRSGSAWNLQQRTNGTFEVRDAVISGNGNYAIFTANADLAGDNPGNLRVLFRYLLQNDTTQQVLSAGLQVTLPDIDESGNRITFQSDSDPLGLNPLGIPQLFLWDARGPGLQQITRATEGESGIDPSINDEGTMIAFGSTANLLGSNPNGGTQLYFATCGPRTRTFSDVPLTHPYFGVIGGARAAGVLRGFPNGTFRPGATMTRGQMATAIYNASGRPTFTVGGRVFSDVPSTNADYRGVQYLHRALDIGGQGSRFRPNDPASRRETAKWINFFWDEHSPPACTTPIFSDVPAGNPFCRFIEELVDRGVVAGGGSFRPTAAVTRQTAADWLTDAMAVR